MHDHRDRSSAWRRRLAGLLAQVLVLQPLVPGLALAGPEGAQVVHGDVSIETVGSTTVIHASDRSIIEYSSFDIAPNETVQFIQPSDLAAVGSPEAAQP